MPARVECHSERSEESLVFKILRSFSASWRIRMTVVLSLLTFAFLLLPFPHPIFAQEATQSATPSAQVTFPQYAPQSPQYANLLTINLIHTFSCFAEGSSIIGQPCIGFKPVNDGKSTSLVPTLDRLQADGGAIGGINHFLTNLYTVPPLRTAEYIGMVKSDMGLVKPAYAQVSGSGNGVLGPILTIWQVFRNIAYMGLIFILIVIGLMIMFRQKINPQTVISAQSALPGLIIGLIMITFSYFFAAVLVDTTFVATHLAGKLFEGQVIKTKEEAAISVDPIDDLLNKNSVLGIFNYFINDSNNTHVIVKDIGPTQVINETEGIVASLRNDSTIGTIIERSSQVGGCIVGKQIGIFSNLANTKANNLVNLGVVAGKANPLLGLLTGLGGAALSVVGAAADCGVGLGIVSVLVGNTQLINTAAGLLLYLILMFALLIAMFRLLFTLIGAYLTILISTITAPLQFLIGSIPGREKIFGDWIKSMVANLLAFPAVFAAFILAAFILGWQGAPFYIKGDGAGNFSGGVLPLLGGLSSGFLRLILAYGILLMSPNIPNMVKEAFGVKDQLGAGQAVIGAIGGGFGVLRGGFGGLTHRFAQERKMSQQYADLVRTYGPEYVAQKYGKAVQPSLLQPWAYFGYGDVFKPVAPWNWRRQRAAVFKQNEENVLPKTPREGQQQVQAPGLATTVAGPSVLPNKTEENTS